MVHQHPGGSDFSEAIQNPKLTLQDPALADGIADATALGLPRAISGTFASVFHITGPTGGTWAVKCFTSDVPYRDERYGAISAALSKLDRPWRVRFEYEREGILVAGNRYPIVKMEWLEAKGLLLWLEANRYDSLRVSHIAAQFAAMVADLEGAGISHGDLQHGNLLVDSTGTLRLIDYDGMFVPGTEALGAAEKGHENYQSPARGNEFGPGLDRFSAWIIWVSLCALAVDPALWDQLHMDGEEKLIFGKDDYVTISGSPALGALRASPHPDLAELGARLESLFRLELDDLPVLHVGIGAATQPAPSAQSLDWITAGVAPTPGAGLPDWMRTATVQQGSPPVSHTGSPTPTPAPAPQAFVHPTSTAQSVAGSTTAGASWIASHLPVERVRYSAGVGGVRAWAYLWAAAAVIAAGLAIFSPGPPSRIGFGAAALLSSMLLLVGLLVSWRRRPELKQRAEARTRARFCGRAEKAAQEQTRALERQRADSVSKESNEIRQLGQRRSAVEADERKAIDAASNVRNREMKRIDAEVQSLAKQENDAKTGALQRLRSEHVRSQLGAASIARADIYGIGETLSARLWDHGIRTAADFTDVTYSSSGRYQNTTAQLRRASGGSVQVPGIGEERARALVMWRRGLEASAQASMPTKIPPSALTAIAAQYRALRANLDGQRAKTDANQRAAVAAAQAQGQKAKADMDRDMQAARSKGTSIRLGIDQQLVSARTAQTQASFANAKAVAELGAFDELTLGRYARLVMVGRR